MKTTKRLIHAGFAACALASFSLPALSLTSSPDVDFEWYANVGRQVEVMPASRPGYIWAPGHYEVHGNRHVWTPGVWVEDRATEQKWSSFSSTPNTTSYTTGPTELRDRDGKVIPIDPNAYNVDSARR